MYIKKYFYKKSDLKLDNKSMIIADTKDFRNKYMSEIFYNLYQNDINSFKTNGRTALLYCGGNAEHHSSSRIYQTNTPKGAVAIKSQMGYIASKVAKRIGNIDFLSINTNTCASSMSAIYEAKRLLKYDDFDDVIIYGEEWVEENELLLFNQSNIDVVCSDGFFILHLSKDSKNAKARIEETTFLWNDDRNPFEVSRDGYIKAMMPFLFSDINCVKMHGTGTPQNDESEKKAIEDLFGNVDTIEYKSQIGHSQGCSTGLELCILIDEYYTTNPKRFSEMKDNHILFNTSGMGNFYGSFELVI